MSVQDFKCLYDEFYQKLNEFFPNQTEIQFYQDMLNDMTQKDPQKLSELFLVHIGPYSSYIFNQDENYLLNNISQDSKLLKLLVSNWNTMSQEQKNLVWFYLQQLLIILIDT
jgi:hypothetical protein